VAVVLGISAVALAPRPAAAQQAGTQGDNAAKYGRAAILLDKQTTAPLNATTKNAAVATFRIMQQTGPRLAADAKALAASIEKGGKAKEYEAAILADARKDRVPPQVLARVQQSGGALKVLANADQIVKNDLATASKSLGLPVGWQDMRLGKLLAYLNPVGTAEARWGIFNWACSVGMYTVYQVCHVSPGQGCNNFLEDGNHAVCQDQ
jgi:hypothetical protein